VIRRYLREGVGLLRRSVVAMEQIAGALEVIQTVFVEAMEEERRKLEEADERPKPLNVDPPQFD